jgi:Bacterial pre-peptidase C-terminal domain
MLKLMHGAMHIFLRFRTVFSHDRSSLSCPGGTLASLQNMCPALLPFPTTPNFFRKRLESSLRRDIIDRELTHLALLSAHPQKRHLNDEGIMTRVSQLVPISLVLLLFLFLVDSARCQGPPPVKPNPQAPTLAVPVPLGMQRGTTLDLTLTGTNLAEPTALWTSFPAKVTIPTDNKNGTDQTKLLVRLEVPKDAPIGFHTIRLATTRGLSNFRIFCIDDLPQVMETDSNHSRATAQAISIPCVVVGRADPEVTDFFKLTVKAGQRVSFEVLGRRLGSAFDPQISLHDIHTGHELPEAYSNDAPGLQTDARLTYTFKDAGEYVLEIRDTTYRGGPDFWYRLRIGNFPCATTPIPMAIKRGSKARIHFSGPTVDGVAPAEVTAPTDPNLDVLWIAPNGANGLSGWPVALALSDLDETVEQEPNNDPAHANRLSIPSAVTGRFLEKGDVDYFVFSAKKDQRLIIQGESLEYYSPTLLDMTVNDAKGAQVAASNPQAAHPEDQRIDFKPPADGDYYLLVKHLTDWGGPSEVYRLTITPYQPGFHFTVGLDRFDAPPGGAVEVPIQTLTRRDYTGPIEISVVGHPGITGQTVINATPPPPPNQPAGKLTVSVKSDVPMGPYSVRIQGKATINGQPVVVDGDVSATVKESLAGLPFPPRDLLHSVGLAVTEKPPFSLLAKLEPAESIRGTPISVTVAAQRAPGFAEEIALSPQGLPPNVALPALKIDKDKNEVKAQFTPTANAPVGKFAIGFQGKAKVQFKEFTVLSSRADLALSLPFDLKVEPTALKIPQGGKAKIKITATRKAGYQGPIDLEVRNLPAKTTAPKANIAMGQDSAEVEVTAPPDAMPGEKKDVNVLGTATAAGNQQNATPNFTLTIEKK